MADTPTPTINPARRAFNNRIFVVFIFVIILSFIQFITFHVGKSVYDSLHEDINQWKADYKELKETHENEEEHWKKEYEKMKDELMSKTRKLKRNHAVEKEKLESRVDTIEKTWEEKYNAVKEELQLARDAEETDAKLWKAKYDTAMELLRHFPEQAKRAKEKNRRPKDKNDAPKKPNKPNHEKKPLNIVLLYADDWRYDTLNAAGNDIIHTPNINRLAEEGMLFTHNCVTTSVCWISRGTLATGQYLRRHKSPTVYKASFMEYWNETYYGLLRDNGYDMGYVGKWHYAGFPMDQFDFKKLYYGYHINEVNGMHITEENERDSLEYLRQRPKDKPFCLTVAFFATHAVDGSPGQFYPQNKSQSLYQEVDIPVPPSATQESWERLPYFFTERNEGRIRWHWRFDDPDKYQKMMKNYYRMATEVDTACGNIIRELEAQGIMDNTIVIFTTDNGYYHGEHGLGDKWYPHQESIRVPLVIRDPRMSSSRKGQTSDEFTLNIDLAPTLVSAAGLDPPERMQGRDMSELYRTGMMKEDEPWRQEFFYEHPTIDNNPEWWISSSEALVRKDFKYILWPGFDLEQLFDLKADPYEENDLATIDTYADQLEEMRATFLELRKAAE